MNRRDFLAGLAAAVSAPLGASMGASLPPLPAAQWIGVDLASGPDATVFIEACRFVQSETVFAFAIPPRLLLGVS